jgi:ornithine aminotransferase
MDRHPIRSELLIEAERQHCAPNYQPIPVVIERALDCHVWDVDGKRYLDMMGAYSAVSHGHLHPRIVAAAQRQLGRVAVTSRAYHGDTLGPFLEKLCALAGFEQALPMNTGAEAVETAIKAARRWGHQVRGLPDGTAEILVARQNFHGRTTTVISASSEPSYRAGFGPFTPGFRWFDFGDMASVRAATTASTCAVLVEPVQGEAGVVLPPPGFFAALRAWCDANRILLIADEVQSGLGRTGRWFAFEHEGIRPDGLILGKALGGGLLPVSAFLADRRLMQVFSPGSHGSTFGGNALAAAVAHEALRVMEDEQLVARSAALGAHLLARLRGVQAQWPTLVRSVRGRGLWVGVDLDPAHASAREVVERMAQAGVLSKETHETVIRFAPPLTITRALIDEGVDRFAEVLAALPGAGAPRSATATQAAPDAAPLHPRLLMSAPTHFDVSYAINPWMEPDRWRLDDATLRQQARAGWEALRATYEGLGAVVETMPPVAGLPDMVFTANAAVVVDRQVLLARFRHPERRGEEAHGRALFEQLRARGLVDRLHVLPEGVCFEGNGDVVVDNTRGICWMGHGPRSDLRASETLQAVARRPVLALELVDPRFYHLDTCLSLLTGGELLAVRRAFSPQGWQQLQDIAGTQLIAMPEEDALQLAANAVCIGRDLVMGHCSATLRQLLEERGYRARVVPLDAFRRSGGSARCLTLELGT